MNLDVNSVRVMRAMGFALAVIIIMSVAAEVLKPMALATLLAFILVPVVKWLQHRGLPRVVGVAAVLLFLFSALAGLIYVVGDQFVSLADNIPTYQANIHKKFASLRPDRDSSFDKVSRALESLESSIRPSELGTARPVRVISENATLAQLTTFFGPFHALLAWGGVVLLLLVFFLMESEEIYDRTVQMVGSSNIGVTTKTMTQISHVLSKYLTTLALFNAGFGTVIGFGLWAIGLPSPALWGFLAALFRFVPYLGPLIAFSLPELISIAHFPSWTQPILVLALFAAAELVANSIEPLVYGKTTGISPVALLVTALFWTWIWGGLGLLLANALTVCLAVVGQSIPSLGFLGTLLRQDVDVAEDLRWYQRVLRRDQDGAVGMLEDALKTRPLEVLCDEIVIPTLARAEQDLSEEYLDKQDVAFIWRVVRDWLDDLADRDDLTLAAPAPNTLKHVEPVRVQQPTDTLERPIVGIAANGGADALVLRMLKLVLKPTAARMVILSGTGSPLHVSDKVEALAPGLLVVSHLPPLGLTRTRYLIRRLRARYPEVPMIVGFWNAKADAVEVAEQLHSTSAYHVGQSLGAVRTMILDRTVPKIAEKAYSH